MNIAIIPARLSSKTIKKKNIKLFFKKPIISYVIQEAIKSKIFDKIIVSTESKLIKKISEKYGAKVPFIRNPKLSRDNVPIRKVILDTIYKLEKLEKIEIKNICCLFPTSVLIDRNDIVNAYNLFKKKNRYIFSACAYEHPIQRSFSIYRNEQPKALNKKFLKKEHKI